MQKNDVTKLACALQTILKALLCACVMTVEIANSLYLKKKEKLNSIQMTKMMRMSGLLFRSMF